MKYIEQKMGRDTIKFHEFDSIHDLLGHIDGRPVNTKIQPGYSLASHRQARGTEERPAWEGTNTYKQAMDLFVNGWTYTAEKLAKRIKPNTSSQFNTKTKPNYSVVGGTASVPRYVMGIPTNMIDRKQIPMKSKIIVINKSINFPAMVSADSILEEGVRALQIIQALEGKGYRVKLNVVWMARSGSEVAGFKTTIKKPEERFSLIKVAFPIANPAMLRRIGFRWMETNENLVSGWGSYGAPEDTILREFLDKKEIYLPKHIPDVDKYIEKLGY